MPNNPSQPSSQAKPPVIDQMNWGGLSRRHFLKGLLATAGAVGVGASVTACTGLPGEGPDAQPLLFLDTSEVAILNALGEAIIPTQAGFPDLASAGVIRRIDQELALVDESITGDFRSAIDVLQFAPFLYGRFSRFTKLGLEARREVLQSLMRSRSEILRAVGSNLKLVIHFYYFAHPSTWAAMGYDGPFGKIPPRASEQDQWYQQKAGLAPKTGAAS